MNLQQIRLFRGGGYDMSYILGINARTSPDTYTLYPYYDNGEEGYWTGEEGYTFSDKTSPLSIFIDDVADISLRYNCLVEFSGVSTSHNLLDDTSSNGNVGILVGDYEVKRVSAGVETMRDSTMTTLKVNEDIEKGAV